MDTYNEHSPINPINQKELPEATELEDAHEYIAELRSKLKKAKKQVNELIDYAEVNRKTYLLGMLKKIKL